MREFRPAPTRAGSAGDAARQYNRITRAYPDRCHNQANDLRGIEYRISSGRARCFEENRGPKLWAVAFAVIQSAARRSRSVLLLDAARIKNHHLTFDRTRRRHVDGIEFRGLAFGGAAKARLQKGERRKIAIVSVLNHRLADEEGAERGDQGAYGVFFNRGTARVQPELQHCDRPCECRILASTG